MEVSSERPARVLLLSQRRLHRQVANSCLFEFEDTVAAVDDVDVVAVRHPHRSLRMSTPRRAQLAVRLLSGGRSGRAPVWPYPAEFRPDHDYDLLLAVFDNPWDLEAVNMIRGFRQRCRHVVAFISEIWAPGARGRRFRMQNFDDFDHIFVSNRSGVAVLREVTGVPSSYLPPGVDALRFAPAGPDNPRPIDVAYLGRRSEVAHRALLTAAENRDWFYYWDAIPPGPAVPDPAQHRRWLASLLRRTRYAVTNHARADQPSLHGGVKELGYRHFENTAAGAVLIGAPPDPEAWRALFPWNDALITADVDDVGLADTISALDEQPERVAAIRWRNVAGALRRHDWVERWATILDTVGVSHVPAMRARRRALETAARRWEV